ncbi:MAG TPA: DUF2905 domain-containing protein [Anaerolineales bacterium]|jgi:hypothetical protein
MDNLARFIILAGVALIITGVLVYGLEKLNLPLGRLPGDIHIEGKNGSFSFPLTTCILVSIVLSVILNVISKLLRK